MGKLNLFGLSGILVCISSLSMVILLAVRGRRNKANLIWTCYSLGVAIWGFCAYKISTTKNYEAAFLLWQIAYSGLIIVPVLFLHFVCTFIGLKRRVLIIFSYVCAIIFEIGNFAFRGFFIGEISFAFDQFYWTLAPGPLLHSFTFIFVFAIVIYSFIELIRELRRTTNARKKIQLKYFLIGSALGWGGAFPCFLINYGLNIYPYGNIFVIFYPFLFTYAIVKHQLMDVNVVLKRGLVYSVLVAVITAVYFLFVMSLGRLFQGVVGLQSFVVNLSAVFIIAILFNPIRSKIQRFLDKRFFKGTLESLTEEKNRLQQELFHKEKLAYVGQLASSVVHEIKNPLTALKAFAEYLPQKYNDPEFRAKLERLLPQEIARIERVVLQLLDLAKPREVSFQPLNITQVIESTLLLLENNFRLKKINIIRDFPPEEVIIQGDEEQLRQVFLNLFLNSIQAMDEGGTLTITTHLCSSDKKSVLICVQDTGSGISEDNLNKLFTPFFTTKKEGIGLGLSISRELIEEHQGKISVESEKGKGTKFTLEFPI